ncbi:hypothetical protein LZ198_19095 [Myxococcus sp. K15C18031901]|uniref:hypothetical protein n=1 Tax=Myxococcus dinghuensis TaxID=2906761 RepID=UPI0020A834B6|nr:hypothetical protein [Myxococcus dinghuensis]MCP3100984.1 hypothetical protein [Myxococcus dinghuensis]
MGESVGRVGLRVVLAALVTGCGGFERSVYDIELDAEELGAVPFQCVDGRAGKGEPWDLVAQQRWTLTAGGYGDARMEVPGFYRTRFHGDTGVSDDVPYIIGGSSSSEGPFHFLTLDSDADDETSYTYAHRFFIDGDSLEADRIEGFVETRTTWSSWMSEGTCSSRVRFTGHRVAE